MKRLRRLLSLSWFEYRSLLIAVFWVGLIRLMLSFCTFDRLLKQFKVGPQSPGFVSSTNAEKTLKFAPWAVRAVSRFVPKASCLTQSLALYNILSKNGIPCKLRIGIAKDNKGDVEAHAWIESDGKVVSVGEDVSRFSVFPEIESFHS